MSDARPITNITDYICGNCWSSFSRGDPGVIQGERTVCPHCGHEQPREGGDLAELVRNAPEGSVRGRLFTIASGGGPGPVIVK